MADQMSQAKHMYEYVRVHERQSLTMVSGWSFPESKQTYLHHIPILVIS